MTHIHWTAIISIAKVYYQKVLRWFPPPPITSSPVPATISCFAITSVTSRTSLTLTKAFSLPKATNNNSNRTLSKNYIFLKFLYLFRVLFTFAGSFNNDTLSPQVGFHGEIFFFVGLSSFSSLCVIFLAYFKIIHILELQIY